MYASFPKVLFSNMSEFSMAASLPATTYRSSITSKGAIFTLLINTNFTEMFINMPVGEVPGNPSPILPFFVVSEFGDRPFTFLVDFVRDSNHLSHVIMPIEISFIHVTMPDHAISRAVVDPPQIYQRAHTTVCDFVTVLRISLLEFPFPVEILVGARECTAFTPILSRLLSGRFHFTFLFAVHLMTILQVSHTRPIAIEQHQEDQ
jgi:hypothetical protein